MKLSGLLINNDTGEVQIARGDDQDITFTVTDPLTGLAQNVTGGSFSFTVKTSIDDAIGDAKFQKTSGGGGIDVTGAANGIIVVSIAAADTQALAGVYQWDLQMVLTGKTRTLSGGVFRVRKDVTTPGSAGQASSPLASFPGSVSVAGTLYLQDVTTLLWSGFRLNNGVLEQSASQSATIPFTF